LDLSTPTSARQKRKGARDLMQAPREEEELVGVQGGFYRPTIDDIGCSIRAQVRLVDQTLMRARDHSSKQPPSFHSSQKVDGAGTSGKIFHAALPKHATIVADSTVCSDVCRFIDTYTCV
jgi:hypothetical protein